MLPTQTYIRKKIKSFNLDDLAAAILLLASVMLFLWLDLKAQAPSRVNFSLV